MTTLQALSQMMTHRTRIKSVMRRSYRTVLGAGLAAVLVGGTAAGVVNQPTPSNEQASQPAVGALLETELPDSPEVEAPSNEDVDVESFDIDVELEKSQTQNLRDVEAAQRAQEREEREQQAAEEEAAAEQEEAAEEQAAEEQAAAEQEESAEETSSQQESAEETSSQQSGDVASAGSGDERGTLAGKVNGLRSQNGLSGLSRDATLDQVAQSWAEHMASTQNLAHNPNLDGDIGSGWSRSGENIVRNTGAQGWSSARITSWMFDWWYNSGPHYANMTNSAYTHIGVGYAMGSGGPYAALVFGAH